MNENNQNELKTFSWGTIIIVVGLLAVSLGALIYFLMVPAS